MESFNKFVISHDPEQHIGLNEMAPQRWEEIMKQDILVDREEFGWDIMNNFYMYFFDTDESRGWIERDTKVGWFGKYLETHGEQFELLRELLNAAFESANEQAGDLRSVIGQKDKMNDFYEKQWSVFEPVLNSVMDALYDQYKAMYTVITPEDLEQYGHRDTRVGLLGH